MQNFSKFNAKNNKKYKEILKTFNCFFYVSISINLANFTYLQIWNFYKILTFVKEI